MNTTHSADGTLIAFDRLGSGSPVVLVSGASCARGVHAPLAELVAAGHTVLNYDRRGRGDSGDTQPYAVEREIEDLAAVIAEADGSAAVFGNSSGGVLALRAASVGVPITRLTLWEPPFQLDADAPRRAQAYATELTACLAEGRRGDAMALFMRSVGLPPAVIDQMRQAPMWASMDDRPDPRLRRRRHGRSLPPDRPGGRQDPHHDPDRLRNRPVGSHRRRALLDVLPSARHTILEGQAHNVSWDVLAPHLTSFLG